LAEELWRRLGHTTTVTYIPFPVADPALLVEGDTVESVTISSPDGLNILRHSTAHVLAQAVQSLNPEAKLGIGPPIKDGFYYDFERY